MWDRDGSLKERMAGVIGMTAYTREVSGNGT